MAYADTNLDCVFGNDGFLPNGKMNNTNQENVSAPKRLVVCAF